ncbi:MAG TPA: hypothetical protein VL463_00345 [Kofleriaceae bacterium]|nr:hypothetical protein [Kofleriaceae bacterium]
MRRLACSLIVFAACETAGDRSFNGQCPQGETCSTKTPKGLHFRGPDFADDWIADATIKRTAVGGTQTITILNAQDEQQLAFPYTTSIDSASLTADAPNGALLTLHGASAGTGMLRINDAADGKLFDRVTVEATEIGHADVVAFHDEALLASDAAPAIMVNTDVQLMARLYDSSGLHRLVDQSTLIAVTGQSTAQTTWDTVALTPNAIGTIGVTLRAGGQQRATGSITVVDSIDAVVPGYTSFDATFPPKANQSLVACIEAIKGAQPVVGLDWTLSISGADTSTSWVASNCMTFTRTTAGAVTLHGSAGGKSADFVIDVGAAAAAPYVPHADVTPGEYAASFD